jgi:O2-independent ubiquinone biosynthesis protein UbiV
MNDAHSSTRRLSLTLGPVLYNWPVPRWIDFYARIADEAAVDRVCIGEVVCSKRKPFFDDVMLETVDRLERGGKEVVYATLALPTNKREIRDIGDMIRAGYLVEANDIATVHLLDGRPHAVGPFVNVYNEDTLALHLKLGARRVCLPPELPIESIAKIAAGNDAVEVFAFGRPPLALSARCYTARAQNMTKDSCQFVCEAYGDGMEVDTLDGMPFLAVNGIQTQGYVVTAVTHHVAALAEVGVVALRLSPQTCDMVKVAKIYRDLADGNTTPPEADEALAVMRLPGPLSDGFLRGLPGCTVETG